MATWSLEKEWRALPRAARWKLIVGVTIVFNSLAAQIFLVWLYAHFSGPRQPTLFPYLKGWPLELWMSIVRITLDDAHRKQAIDALALNMLVWALWVVWLVWRETKRNKVNSDKVSVPG